MKNELFIKKVDKKRWVRFKKKHPSAMFISEYDLGYKGLFGIKWGYLAFRYDMFKLNLLIKYPIVSKISWKIKSLRYKTYREGKNLMLKDRFTVKTKEVGRFV